MLAGKPYCSECERLKNENSLLRQQIAQLSGSDSLLASNRWQTLLIVGWLLLTILPTMAALLTSFDTSDLLEYVGYGIGIGASWSQCSILFLVLVLLDVRPSQKLLIVVLASVGFFTCWVSTKDMQALDQFFLVPQAGSPKCLPSGLAGRRRQLAATLKRRSCRALRWPCASGSP